MDGVKSIDVYRLLGSLDLRAFSNIGSRQLFFQCLISTISFSISSYSLESNLDREYGTDMDIIQVSSVKCQV